MPSAKIQIHRLVFLIATLFLSLCAAQTRSVVPNVRGKQLQVAQRLLEELGLRPGERARVDDASPAGTVIGQDIPAGSPAIRGASIGLTVSSGRVVPAAKVPNVYSRTLEEARKILSARNLMLRPVGSRPSTQPDGTVIVQLPAAGSDLPPDRVVNVTLASALPPRLFVPMLRGLTQIAAMRAISSARLTTGEVTRRPDSAQAGLVVSQDPQPGQPATPGSSVNFQLSSGPVPPAETRVPNLRGQSVASAEQQLMKRHLLLGSAATAVDLSQAGTIFQQSLAAETPVAFGTTVNVSVSSGGVVVPDLVGHARSVAASILSDGNLRLGAVTVSQSPEPAGTVFEQIPLAGAIVALNNAVSIFVSGGAVPNAGGPIPNGVIPDVVDQQEQQAIVALGTAGFRAYPLTRQASSEPVDTVIAQSPGALTPATAGKQVQLFIARGEVPPISVTVPDVSGLTFEKARDILGAAKLIPVDVTGRAGSNWVVNSQTPAPYATVQRYSEVRLSLLPAGSILPWLAAIALLGVTGAVVYLRWHPGRLSFSPYQDPGSPQVRMKRADATDRALKFESVRDFGKQTFRAK